MALNRILHSFVFIVYKYDSGFNYCLFVCLFSQGKHRHLCKLFAGGLAPTTTEEDIRAYFSQINFHVSCEIWAWLICYGMFQLVKLIMLQLNEVYYSDSELYGTCHLLATY